MKPRYYFNSKIPKLFKADGITLYPCVFIASGKATAESSGLLAHEQTHVEQIQKIGFWSFYVSYFLYYFAGRLHHKNHKDAYLQIPFEIEAYNVQRSVAGVYQ